VAGFIKGDVVVVPFPFSDLSSVKRRPAFVIAVLDGNDLILCQITSQGVKDHYAISVNDGDFTGGGLKQPSNIRPNRIFTADNHIILYKIVNLKVEKISEVVASAVKIIQK
jgi:mRNA interferase MazF